MTVCPSCGFALIVTEVYDEFKETLNTWRFCSNLACSFKETKPERKTKQAYEDHLRFQAAIQEELARRNQIALTVLVMGPGAGGTNYDVRVRIKELLASHRHNVIFPEDSVMRMDLTNLFAAELMLVEHADWVVILNVSPGSLAEAYDFTKLKSVLDKVTIFGLDSHKRGYSAQGWLNVPGVDKAIEYVSADDLTNGVLTTKIVEYAQRFREIKWLRSKGVQI